MKDVAENGGGRVVRKEKRGGLSFWELAIFCQRHRGEKEGEEGGFLGFTKIKWASELKKAGVIR